MMVVPSIASDQFAAIRCDHAAPMVLADQPGAAPDGAAPDGAAVDESSSEGFQQIILTACGERGRLMTRAAANQIDSSRGSQPSFPFPTVLALELRLHGRGYFLLGSDSEDRSPCFARIWLQLFDTQITPIQNSPVDFSSCPGDTGAFLRNEAAPPQAQA